MDADDRGGVPRGDICIPESLNLSPVEVAGIATVAWGYRRDELLAHPEHERLRHDADDRTRFLLIDPALLVLDGGHPRFDIALHKQEVSEVDLAPDGVVCRERALDHPDQRRDRPHIDGV